MAAFHGAVQQNVLGSSPDQGGRAQRQQVDGEPDAAFPCGKPSQNPRCAPEHLGDGALQGRRDLQRIGATWISSRRHERRGLDNVSRGLSACVAPRATRQVGPGATARRNGATLSPRARSNGGLVYIDFGRLIDREGDGAGDRFPGGSRFCPSVQGSRPWSADRLPGAMPRSRCAPLANRSRHTRTTPSTPSTAGLTPTSTRRLILQGSNQ
jgi:hypothetical protein